MIGPARSIVPPSLVLVALAACGGGGSSSPRRDAAAAADAGADAAGGGDLDAGADASEVEGQLVVRAIAPRDTDPALGPLEASHLEMHLDDVAADAPLFVFLPGTLAQPDDYELVLETAARAGWRAIGLTYPNGRTVGMSCARRPPSCYEEFRLETIDGIDRTDVTDVDAPNSIVGRLLSLLRYLDEQYPGEDWLRTMVDDAPAWALTGFGGHSQGGGHAALIAREHAVARVMMLSAPVDNVDDGAIDWTSAQHATAVERYWGLVHADEGTALFSTPGVIANWSALGMDVLGPLTGIDDGDPPWGTSHELQTSASPASGNGELAAHASTGIDEFTPLAPDGTPRFAPAWRAMLQL